MDNVTEAIDILVEEATQICDEFEIRAVIDEWTFQINYQKKDTDG